MAGRKSRARQLPPTAQRRAREIVEVDARDTESVAEAAHGMDVILHALNPPYTHWPTQVPVLAEAAIAAARASDATLVLPGNLYNYGAAMPGGAR